MDNRAQSFPPAAREEGLLVEEVGDEKVVYDVETKEAHALSVLAAAVFAGSDGRRTLDDLATFAAERTGEPVSEDQVWDALIQLEERNLLKPPTGGMSRRGFAIKTAGVAMSVPLITSLAMPSIASAASCIIGRTCTAATGGCVNVAGTTKTSVTMCDGADGDCNSCACVGIDQPNKTLGYLNCTGAGGACSQPITKTGAISRCGWV